TFDCASSVELTAVASGSVFYGWSNGCTGTGVCSITLNDATTVGVAFTRCGNHVTELGEQCDDGNGTNGDACENNCTLPRCGNGIHDFGEQCDDGNLFNGDGCENTCTFTPPGDGDG